MKKSLLALGLCVMAVYIALAQTSLPPAYEIITDTVSHNINLPDSNWQMMADPTGKMTLQQVVGNNFKDTIREPNYKADTYWLRCWLINKMSKEAKVSFASAGIARADFYFKTGDGKWEHLKTGTEVPWKERDGLKRIFYVNITIPPGKEILVYKRDYFDYVFQQANRSGIGFGFTENIIQQNYVTDDSNYITDIGRAFMLGLFILALVINLYFFVIVREKEFLYFSLFVLCLGLNNIPDAIFRNYPQLPLYLNLFGNFLQFFFLIYFVRFFLKTFSHFPRWDKWLIMLSFLSILTFSAFFLSSYVFHINRTGDMRFILYIVLLILVISLLITFLLYIRYRDRPVRLMLIAIAPLLCMDVLFLVLINIWLVFGNGLEATIPPILEFLLNHNEFLFGISYLWMVLIFSWVLFLRFSMLRKKLAMQELEKEKERSAFIEQQKTELEKQVIERTSELKQSLDNLKSTQKQLIQSEKMASLGELTAGIAYEIQNPLNFVNNFSDVNKELLGEMKDEIDKGNYEEVKGIANDVIENQEKIHHHGKRADAIVKGMLQHSRVSTGVREPTDINALADEYLRLVYHGMRAKDKDFNVTIKSDFDETIGKVNIVPQDIGRVILNLINNAFYAVDEKKKQLTKNLPGFQNLEGLQVYEPTVSVKTSLNPPLEGREAILITVSDNGNGIPQNIVDKIFQPFFTTKPIGQGTGLGLSLSYDIIKAHGGELKVETKEGEGSKFIIQLPVV